ncbi:MAG: WcaF family extracellular polysaccharide biosynthesis acetyltransferase [Pseudomonadales bacterium]
MIKLNSFNNSDFDRGASKTTEVFWWIFRSVFFAAWFPFPSVIKVKILRMFGARLGEGIVIRSRVNISFPWRLSCGDNVWIGDDVTILSLAEVSIGSSTCISQKAYLCTGSHDFNSEYFDLITKPIVIGSGCWVGSQSFIAPGVAMGDGSRSMSCAAVVKDVGGGVTVAGVPASEKLPKE